jgi:hypothetical protein
MLHSHVQRRRMLAVLFSSQLKTACRACFTSAVVVWRLSCAAFATRSSTVALPIATHVQDREWRLISNRVNRMVREHSEVHEGGHV